MTTPINIDSLKSSLLEKKVIYNTLSLAIERKETESRMLPSSIEYKNSVCVDLVEIISEETSEYNKLISLIREKKAERDFLYQQMTEQNSSTTPHSIQILINKLDNEILSSKIYCDALNQSIIAQTAAHDALMESVNIESTDYKNLDPEISLLKDKTHLISIELETATTEYETLSGEITASNYDDAAVTLTPDLNNYSIDLIQQENEQDDVETVTTSPEITTDDGELIQDQQIVNNDLDQKHSVSNEETTPEITTDQDEVQNTITIDEESDSFSIDPVEQQLNELGTAITSDEFKLDQKDFEHNPDQNDTVNHGGMETETSTVHAENENTFSIDDNKDSFSIDPDEQQLDELETTSTSPELDPLDDEFKFDYQDFKNSLDQNNNALSQEELTPEVSTDQDVVTIDTDEDVFSIDPTTLENEQDSELNTALASAELDAIEDEFNFDFHPVEEDIPSNRRKTTRYIRSDIKTKLIIHKFFGVTRPFDVDLLDVSSKGALIKTSAKISKNANITIKFNFQLDARRFSISGKVIRKAPDSSYGIKFSKYQNEFADHLLSTQTNLVFK